MSLRKFRLSSKTLRFLSTSGWLDQEIMAWSRFATSVKSGIGLRLAMVVSCIDWKISILANICVCESNYLFVEPEANLLQLSINFLRLLYKIILYINTHVINIKLFLLFAGWCKFFYKREEQKIFGSHKLQILYFYIDFWCVSWTNESENSSAVRQKVRFFFSSTEERRIRKPWRFQSPS